MINSKPIIDLDGIKRWRNKKGQLHRENGPVIIYTNRSMYWCINGQSHRLDGPSNVYASGHKSWYLENFFVRDFSYD